MRWCCTIPAPTATTSPPGVRFPAPTWRTRKSSTLPRRLTSLRRLWNSCARRSVRCMRKFEVLFDHGEASPVHSAYAGYGKLGFPGPPADRPWIFANFVQTLDGITSWKGEHALGSDISRSAEDRWLMDLLRAHADAVLLGSKTLEVERTVLGPTSRGATYMIEDPQMRDLRGRLGHRRETVIFVTGSAALKLSDYAAFDGDKVDAVILTARAGAAKLAPQQGAHPQVRVLAVGEDNVVDLPAAMRLLA